MPLRTGATSGGTSTRISGRICNRQERGTSYLTFFALTMCMYMYLLKAGTKKKQAKDKDLSGKDGIPCDPVCEGEDEEMLVIDSGNSASNYNRVS